MLSQASSGVCVMRLSARITGTENTSEDPRARQVPGQHDRECGDQADPRARAHRRTQPEGHRGGGGPQEGGCRALIRDRPRKRRRVVLQVGDARPAPAPAPVAHHEDHQAHDDGDGRHREADPHEALRVHRSSMIIVPLVPGRTCHPLA